MMGEDDYPVGDTSRPSDGSARATARWGVPETRVDIDVGHRPDVPVDDDCAAPRLNAGRGC